MSDAHVRAARMRGQRLDGRASDPVELARHLVGVQAQDVRAAALSVRARTEGVDAARLARAIETDRSLVRMWAMRGTLHLVASEDSLWLHELFSPPQLATERRTLAKLGVSEAGAERAVTEIRRALADGPLMRAELCERLERAGIDTSGRLAAHLPHLAALEGHIVFGPRRAGKDTYVLAADWLGPRPAVAREDALAELARRYARAFGPADPADFAAWSGLGLRDARAGWERARPTAAEAGPPDPPLVRLVPAFDTYLLGYRGRELAVAPEHAAAVWPGGGIVRATVLANGLACATWSLRRSGARHVLEVQPFGEPPDVSDEAADIGRFLGAPVEVSPGGE